MKMVLNFGCPRSGTTFVQRLFEQGQGFIAAKMPEGCPSHPVNSHKGLLSFMQIFHRFDMIFVRTYRDILSIFESFRHARGKDWGTISYRTDEDIFHFAINERVNFLRQKDTIIKRGGLVFEACLEDEAEMKKMITNVFDNINNAFSALKILDFFDKNYKKVGVRQGKLVDDCTTKYLQPEEEGLIRARWVTLCSKNTAMKGQM